ncbi:DEAD/DEAH box helicase family protein [Flavobacterium amniphilum]|uniref:DEAD/DEAH box helicase n=1 Tax=Flavobacterium amniphilum TaxID=1834035 RepID=UPI00202A49BC|nr:DEAD/DEAH box helicase [Flavobacterium amniphilum]MCL9806944.1 DEAD/DEAH box helicase family protein [Flavobacterium amniphilum]
MNIFSKKLLATSDEDLPIHPIDIFQGLFHKEGYSYLRGIQEEVLNSWHSIRDQRDVLCKMNTGSGKTLVSLLMLHSKMNEGVGTSLYLCPDKQLLEQAKKQAELYGIPVCEINEDNDFPTDFHNCKSILLCTFQKLFNSKSIFNRDKINIGSLVIDDAHSCLDKARDTTTINLPRGHSACERIIKLFETDLIDQAPGTYRRLFDGDPFASILKVPYWAWMDRIDEVITLLNEFSDDNELKFKWGLISDDLLSYDCYLGPRGIEIAPIHVPYQNVKSFTEAKHKYILSATFEDQTDLIKDFGINSDSIINALIPKDRKDIGQRLILAPKRFDPSLFDTDIYKLAKDYALKEINVVILVPSYAKAVPWVQNGAVFLNEGDINDNINNLKLKKGGLHVLVNRYDGVDLNGDMCRILILDGYPVFTSSKELYTEMRLESVKASLKAQIIEQGLGRGVRSGSDYCAVILMGNDLLQFLGNRYNLQYFTSVTRKQLEMGLSLLDEEDKENSLKTIADTIDFCLSQNIDWRTFHSQGISKVEVETLNNEKIKNINIAEYEKQAIDLFRSRSYTSAKDTIVSKIIDGTSINDKQKGWYFQYAAQLLYLEQKVLANDLQIRASALASHMFKTKLGNNYTKISVYEEQSSNIKKFISQFDKSQDFKIYLEEVLNDLKYSPEINSTKFENALANCGRIIGFYAQEPEFEYGNGPDVLWGMTDNHFLVLEAKSMAIHTEITRDNIGQLLQSGEWFKKQYGESTKHTLVTLQSPKVKGYNVNPSENTKVIDDATLDKIRKNLSQFVNGIVSIGINAITPLEISKLLVAHNFTPSLFRGNYLSDIVAKRK